MVEQWLPQQWTPPQNDEQRSGRLPRGLQQRVANTGKGFPKYFMVCGNLCAFVTLILKSVFGVKTPEPISRRPAEGSGGGSTTLWTGARMFITFQIPVKFGTKASGRDLKMKINLTFQRKKTQQPCIQIDKRLASPDENQSLVMAQPDPVQVNIFGLIRVVCTENVLPIWQIWTTSAERSWQILPELVASYPKRLETFCWNHLRIIHIWFLISVQLRAAAAHTISKGTNLFLERYPVGFASQSQSDVSRKWGWPDEKSAWSKSLWFILQGPGTRKAAHMSQKPSVPAGFLFKRKIRILRFGGGETWCQSPCWVRGYNAPFCDLVSLTEAADS